MAKMTIQVVLEAKDLDFLTKLSLNHGLKNNSQAVRLMISRYKGMEDYIRTKKQAEQEMYSLKKAKIMID